MTKLAKLNVLLLLVAGCTQVAPGAHAHATNGPPRAPGSEEGPSAAPKAELAWAALEPGTFARARAEHRYLVIDGSAEWCHWCHVMEATTYHDPAVRALLDARFVAVKVDVDTRPDFEERYEDWGWPATVIMTADGVEVGKYRGYIPPDRFTEILRAVVEERPAGRDAAPASAPAAPALGVDRAEAIARAQLDSYWDPDQGGWGRGQKVPLSGDELWETALATRGDAEARRRALVTLDRERALVDPVWGGICQYSTDGDWVHPHYEKLMAFQAGAIESYAAAFALTGDPAWLRTAQAVRGFVDRFLTAPDGAFYASMDADLNAHDAGRPFVAGREYNARSSAERLALGVPRVDTHEYAREGGLAIAAYVALAQAAHDRSALATAERAADRIVATHATPGGGLEHAPGDDGRVLYLADNAAMGFALARLAEATGRRDLVDAAARLAAFLLGDLQDGAGGFLASTAASLGPGDLAERREPFEDNMLAVRFLAHLARLAPRDEYAVAVRRTLAAVVTEEGIAARGRTVGDLLLALADAKPLL